jgi:hypothetical protein
MYVHRCERCGGPTEHVCSWICVDICPMCDGLKQAAKNKMSDIEKMCIEARAICGSAAAMDASKPRVG